MIESSVVFFILLAGGALFLAARLTAQNARQNPVMTEARLRESLAWHESRLEQARSKNWDHDMVERIRVQLEETREQLARLEAEAAPAGRPAS